MSDVIPFPGKPKKPKVPTEPPARQVAPASKMEVVISLGSYDDLCAAWAIVKTLLAASPDQRDELYAMAEKLPDRPGQR